MHVQLSSLNSVPFDGETSLRWLGLLARRGSPPAGQYNTQAWRFEQSQLSVAGNSVSNLPAELA